MFDRNTIIAIVVVMLILLFLPKYMRLVNPPQPVPVQTTETQKPAPADTTSGTAPIAKAPDTTTATPSAPRAETGPLKPDTLPPVPDYVTVQTPLFALTLGSNAEVTRYDLKKYHLYTGGPVDLHHPPTSSSPAVGGVDFDFGDSNPHSLKDLRFKASKTSINLGEGNEDSVTFVAGDSAGPQIRLTYVFNGSRYGFGLALHTEKLSPPETGEYKALWKGGVPFTEPNPAADVQYSSAFAKVGDEVVETKTGKDPKKEFTATGQTGFVAVRSKYFIAALIPVAPAAGTEVIGRNPAPREKTSPSYYDGALRETWGRDASGRWTVYWGPIKYDNLKSLNAGVEETMSWGGIGRTIIKPIAQLLLWALVGLHKFVSNYGVVVVIFAILIKLILWPLTRKSQISMKKMSALQPEITELRETHKNNPQAMNAAIMRLYKERGVNPASGCLLILPQIPVLWALYTIFASTIEFRQAPFFGWIKDLSEPDTIATLPFSIPFYGAHVAILPLIMGATQFIMSKRTMTDPNQKMMLYVMPIFMTLIFNSLPSGLTLYYTLFNLLAIVEQNLIKIPDFTPSVTVIEDKNQKARKPKTQR